MTNATKSLLIIFVTLVAATALVKWQSGPPSSELFRSSLVEVDTSRVNRVVIEQPIRERRFTFFREENRWMVSSAGTGESYTADENALQRAIDRLIGLNVKAVATRDPSRHTRFKVDSTGTRVTLLEDENELASVYIGAPQILSRREFNSYVRPAGDDAVYSVEGFLNPVFNRELDGWRAKQVWDLERSDISRIDFGYPADSSFTISRAGSGWVSEGDTLRSPALSSMLTTLSSLQANSFADTLSVENFGEGLYRIQLHLKSGEQKMLRIRPGAGEDDPFFAVASDFPYVFTLNRSNMENTLLKSRRELLQN
ncbi:MAG: DUF4340 domain-containing protein [Balneolaceae bacterium]|nr:DUF4340 domain-containing protein [Balneolaceae bacterium]